ncbi:MAG: helix-turn-helix domain-containing protein, partial [Coriobacteriales bacterium]|nr:helix-turn-helix domain-containing protein [Coriobacteriales bacterium]
MDNDCHTEPAAAAVSGAGAVATGDPAAVCTPTASLHDDHCACYAALSSHDARFDGRFFVGVTSTGIYCRPVCRAKLPREENCRFFSSAAAAEAAGFRPCMRCRPELAPGLAAVDAQGSLARRAATLIDEGLTTVSLPRLAAAVGTSERHLRRVFEAEFGVSPVQYLQTRRLLLAKSLLTDTRLPVTQVAFAAGFKSVRRFNELFRERYRLQPRDLRKSVRTSLPQGPGITVQLDYRPPFDGQALLGFLAGRTIAGVEAVVDGTYCRSVRITAEEGLEEDAPPTGGAGAVMNTAAGLGAAPAPAPAGHASGSPAAAAATSAATGARGVADGPREYCGWLSVAAAKGKHALALTLSESLLPVLPRVIARVRLLFDLNADPAAIGAVLQTMDDFRPGLYRPGTRLPGSFDSWEMAVRAVLGQQVTVKAAQTLARRLSERFGTP